MTLQRVALEGIDGRGEPAKGARSPRQRRALIAVGSLTAAGAVAAYFYFSSGSPEVGTDLSGTSTISESAPAQPALTPGASVQPATGAAATSQTDARTPVAPGVRRPGGPR